MSQPCPPGARAARRFPRPLPALLGALLSLPSCDAGPRPAVPPSPPPAPSATTAPSPSPSPSSH
ncbi:MAG: hypothetical protein L6R43_03400, partial [Planctomycetes bacterium]|nr:hypothetical protein [Planctomycetota bacterium]